MNVNFLIVGTQKGGTTSLYRYLDQHPDVFMPKEKELHFFDEESNFTDNKPNYENYHKYFDLSGPAHLLGEATPIYMYWADAPRRIWFYNPNMKLIVLLRDPVQRAWSHWRMEFDRKTDDVLFSVAIRDEETRSRSARPYQHKYFSYTDRGFYSEQIRRLLRLFEREQILFLKSEDFLADPQKTLERVCTFLGIDRMRFDTTETHGVGGDYGAVPSDDKAYLVDLFRWDVEEVKSLLGWECKDWLV